MREKAKSFAAGLAKTVGDYLLLMVGGTLLLLIASTLVGYLPYSDRPGPGWHTWRETWSFGQVWYFLSWGTLLAPYAYVLGALFFVGGRLLAWVHSPRWLIAVIAAPTIGYLSFYLVAGLGWYIAISAFPVFGAGVLGILFGAWLLPKHVSTKPRTQTRVSLRHWIALAAPVVIAVVGVSASYVQSLSAQYVEVVFVQWQRGSEPLSVQEYTLLGPSEAFGLTDSETELLRGQGLSGRLAVVGKYGSGLDNAAFNARVVVVMHKQVKAPIDLPLPKGTSAIHIQFDDGWRTLPAGVPIAKGNIRLEPSAETPQHTLCHVVSPTGTSGTTGFVWQDPAPREVEK